MSAFRGTGPTVIGGAPWMGSKRTDGQGGTIFDKQSKYGEGAAPGGGGMAQDLVPAPSDPQTKARADAANQDALTRIEEEDRMRQRGRAATMLTGGQGLLGAPTVARRTLLGA